MNKIIPFIVICLLYAVGFSQGTNEKSGSSHPFEIVIWAQHPLNTATDSIYFALDFDCSDGYDPGFDIIDTTSITSKPVNLLIHNTLVEDQYNTSCVGNLRKEVKLIDTNSNQFTVSFTAWISSDTLMGTLGTDCAIGSAWLKWDFTQNSFNENEEYILYRSEIYSPNGYLCFTDLFYYHINQYDYDNEVFNEFMDSVSVIGAGNLPSGCSPVYGTQLDFTLTFLKKSYLDLVNGVYTNNHTPLSIFPNPASDKLIIEGSFTGGESIFIYDVDGKQVHNVTNTNNTDLVEINISMLKKGSYNVIVKSKNKLIKEKLIKL